MRYVLTFSSFACLAALGLSAPAPALANSETNTADAIRLDPGHPNGFHRFAPELPAMRDRIPDINTDFGLHVREIETGLHFVTDMVYQSAFLVTEDSIVVFDAPPSFGEGLRAAIESVAPGKPITHLIMSHGHSDHNGGSHLFADVADLTVIAAAEVEHTLETHPLRGVIEPTQTFEDSLNLTIGGVPIELQATRFHAEDVDTMVYLPEQKFLMAIDTITPGEVPFMNFGATTDVMAYLSSFETFLAYDFDHFLSGHVSVLGTREDVIANRDYAYDVRDTVYGLMPSFNERMMDGLQAVEFQNANLAYRYAIESVRDECAASIIDRWQDQLSVVDLWADSHCETLVVYAIMH